MNAITINFNFFLYVFLLLLLCFLIQQNIHFPQSIFTASFRLDMQVDEKAEL